MLIKPTKEKTMERTGAVFRPRYRLIGREEERDVTRLKAARKRTGLTQTELAWRTGVPRSVVSGAERGEHVPRGDHVAALYRYLGLDIEDMFADWGVRKVPREEVKPEEATKT
jgi:transcriptional regulator with XRE-family HTH domain